MKVEEPNPAYGQADSAGTNFVTNYTYDLEGHLITVSMPRSGYTQTRTFNYDLPTGRLTSVTQPENGTVSYTYYASGRLQQKLDAKGQKVIYSYDGYGRLEYIDRYPAGAMYYDPCQSAQLTYDGSTGNSMGRVASALIGDMSSCGNQSMKERYSYTAGGLIAYKGYSARSQINYGAFGNLPYSYDFGASYYYDSEGHMTGYGDGSGNTMTYTLDTMGRPTSMTESGSPGKVWAQNVVYGPAGEMKTMQFRTSTGGYYTEARSYNNRVQMTELLASGAGLSGLDLQYNYGAAGSNIGKIASITDAISGEQVTYMYDALQRLSQSETTHSQTTYPGAPWWGQSFGYDGFGNLTTKSPTTGHTATSMSLSVDPVTNHITSSGFAYDANGNMTSIAAAPSNIALSYDVENRTGGQWFDMENRLLYKNGQWYLYGLHGERLGTFTGSATVMNFPCTSVFYVATTQTQTSRNIYFAGRLIQSNGKTVVRDQVGSVRVNEDGEKFEYYPFGEEITLHNPQDREKFGTYTRDSATGLDDANQRTYASVHGVFSSPDRYQASADGINDPSAPQSWNRYAYVTGDPINLFDPGGTCGTPSTTSSRNGSNGEPVFGISVSIPCDPGGTPPSWTPPTGGGIGGNGNPEPGLAPGDNEHVTSLAPPIDCPLVALSGQYTVQSGVVALFAPDLAAKLNIAFATLNSQGIVPEISSGFRTAAKQASVQGSPFGAAQVSWHQAGEAIDFTNNSTTAVKDAIRAALTAPGIDLTWGGVFRRRDPIHYQNSTAGTSPSSGQVASCEREHP